MIEKPLFRMGVRPLMACVFGLACAAPSKPRIERAEQLPARVYKVPADVARLLDDDAAFAELARALRADFEDDLTRFDIRDPTTVKEHLFQLALLDALDGSFPSAIARLDRAAALADKPGDKLMLGLTIRIWADAGHGDFRGALERKLGSMPYDVVAEGLKQLRMLSQILSPSFCRGAVATRVGPAAKGGTISRELAQIVVFQRWALRRLVPVGPVIDEVLGKLIAARTVHKPDIWAARDFKPEGPLSPVVVGIWDSGVDVELFKDRFKGGLAYDVDQRLTPELLFPLRGDPARIEAARAALKGFSDLENNIDSEAAAALKRRLSRMQPEEIGRLLEDLGMMDQHVHGTHVAGIALRDNPAAQLAVARLEIEWRAVPTLPTRERVEAEARLFAEAVAFFAKQGARVVNMSWGFSPRHYESGLEAHGAGGTPDERRKAARVLFDVAAGGLRKAMAGAPQILFVVSAGNDNQDSRFHEMVPSSFDLPNLLVVGAVDQAGDETGFTSFGRVAVHASGYEVESLFPGGARVRLSGTSMAAPQVVNLAAKLLAVAPGITTADLRRIIIDGAEEKTIAAGKTIRLLHPRRSLGLVRK